MLKEEQDEETQYLSSADNHLSGLAARGLYPTTAATYAHPHPTYVDSGTGDADTRATYSHTHPADTHVEPSTSDADASTPHTNGHPADTYADGHTSHSYPGATNTNTCSADSDAPAHGVDGTADRAQ